MAAPTTAGDLHSGAFRHISAKLIGLIDRFPEASCFRIEHITRTAKLIEEIAERIDGGLEIDIIPALDIYYADHGCFTVSFLEEMALRALLRVTPPQVYSVPYKQRHKSL